MHSLLSALATFAAAQPAGDQLIGIGLLVLALAGIALVWWLLVRSR